MSRSIVSFLRGFNWLLTGSELSKNRPYFKLWYIVIYWFLYNVSIINRAISNNRGNIKLNALFKYSSHLLFICTSTGALLLSFRRGNRQNHPPRGIFWRLFPNFPEGGRESLTRTRKFVDSTTFSNDVRNDIFDSISLSKRDRNFLHQLKTIAHYYKIIT